MIEWFDNNVIKSIQESYIMKTQKNSVVQSFNAETAIEKFFKIQNNLNCSKYLEKTHSEIESYITIEGREILRLMLQEHINARGNGWVGEAIEADKQVRDCKRLSTRHYYSPFGQVYVERLGYKTTDAPSIFPLDGTLNLPENCYSHQIQKRVGRAISGHSINDTRIDIHNETSVKIANRQLEEIAYNSSLDFESFYESQVFDETMNNKPINVLSFDGKGIVMKKKHLTEETKKRAERSSHKLEKKLSKGEKKNKKRMATVAAIYSIDRNIRMPEEVAKQFKPIHIIKDKAPPKPVNKKVSASIKIASIQY